MKYVISRILAGIPTLIVVSAFVFLLLRLIPGDPAVVMLGEAATAQAIAEFRAQYGLDRDIFTQFISWFGSIVTGDLGTSIATGEHVLPLILRRFAASGTIVVVAMLLAVSAAIPLGMIAAMKQDKPIDLAIVGTATVLLSIPTLWLGMLLLLVFGLKLGIFPAIGYVSIADNLWLGALYLVMPIITLFIYEVGVVTRMVRATTLEVLHLDYVTHSRAKGLSERNIMLNHVFRNSFGPTWTLIGLILGNLLGGIAVVETVFTVPGLGRLLVDAIYGRDYPVVQGCLLFITTTYILINIIIDITYPLFDPRVTVR